MRADGTFDESSTPTPAPQALGRDSGLSDADRVAGEGEGERLVRPVKDFLLKVEARVAGLLPMEVVALRLWTGPMRVKYTAALAGEPQALVLGLKGNHYPATLRVLLSALGKLRAAAPPQRPKASAMPQITAARSRGYLVLGRPPSNLASADPHSALAQDPSADSDTRAAADKAEERRRGEALGALWEPDSNGHRGGLVAGLVSCTREARVAAAACVGGAVLVEVALTKASGAVDLAWVSQYPAEYEVVLPPNTYLDLHPHYASLSAAGLLGPSIGASQSQAGDARPSAATREEEAWIVAVEASATAWHGLEASLSQEAAWPVQLIDAARQRLDALGQGLATHALALLRTVLARRRDSSLMRRASSAASGANLASADGSVFAREDEGEGGEQADRTPP